MNTYTKNLSKFQEADYYSLEEVAEYLNDKYEKYKFSNLTVLKQLIGYKIPTHVYGFGLTTFGSDFIFKDIILTTKENTNKSESEYTDEDASADLCDFLRVEALDTGLFLQLSQKDLVQIYMQDFVITPSFKDVIPFNYVSRAENLKQVIEHLWGDTCSYYKNKKIHHINQNLINKTKFLFDNFIGVENVFHSKNVQEYLVSKEYLNVKPEIVDIEKDVNHLKEFCFFKIFSEDIYILRKNLSQLEKYLTGEEIYIDVGGHLVGKTSINKTPKGKSQNKEKAQLAAKTLANHFWKKDLKQEIRMKEMCVIVYGELLHTEHKDQLPDHCPSIKEWIKDIAPSYAKEAGRPKEI